MVGRMPNVTWLNGSFAETVKGWQSGWFYITEPRGVNWAAALLVSIRSPYAAHLLGKEGPVLGRFHGAGRTPNMRQSMKDKNIKLVNVIQVMLVRRILPCQRRAVNLWEFVPAEH